MFSFLPLENNSVTIGINFLLASMSAIISCHQRTLILFVGLQSSIVFYSHYKLLVISIVVPMLSIHQYEAFFFLLSWYILNIACAIKRSQKKSKNSEILCTKTIIDELEFLKKTVTIHWKIRTKKIYYDLLPDQCKKYQIIGMSNNTINLI